VAYIERRVAFDYERDSDIIEFLDSMTSHKANQLIRQLIRDYIKDDRHTQIDRIEDKVNRIHGLLKTNNFSVSNLDCIDEIDDSYLEKLSANLENLGV
jgi:hypothetical protein